MRVLAVLLFVAVILSPLAADDKDVAKLLAEAAAAYKAGEHDKVVKLSREAVRLDPSDQATADVARHNRILTHWLQWPIYPIQRFGPIKVWGAYLVLFALAAATGQTLLIVPLVALYLFLVVYSWTVAPLARWWMQRRIR